MTNTTRIIATIVAAVAVTAGCLYPVTSTTSTSTTTDSTYPTVAPYDYGEPIEYPTVTP